MNDCLNSTDSGSGSGSTSAGRIMALDYGRVHTGVAVSDPSGTIVRPLDVISEASSPSGLKKIAAVAREQNATAVIVGIPVTLSGEHGAQALETQTFIDALRETLRQPVFSWDERFTSKLAAMKGRYSGGNPHSIAACCLLEDYLGSEEFRRRRISGTENADEMR